MATSSPNAVPATEAAPIPAGALLVHLAPLSAEALEAALSNLALAFPSQTVVVALPQTANLTSQTSFNTLRRLPYAPVSSTTRTLTAADFLTTYKLAHENSAGACLVLGAECNSLQPKSIQSLASAASTADLTVARYHLGPPRRPGQLGNSLSAQPRSLRRSPSLSSRPSIWPSRFECPNAWPPWLNASPAPIRRMPCSGPPGKSRSPHIPALRLIFRRAPFPQPPAVDLNTILTQIAGSLFTEIEAKAAFWQRVRTTPPRPAPPVPTPIDGLPDVAPMLDSFQLAYNNLRELWSLVLPPQSLLGRKRLAVLLAADFRMPDSLWARIANDFALAYRLRTINRGTRSRRAYASLSGMDRLAPHAHSQRHAARKAR